MDAYCDALSTIKKLGYICDTLLYLADFQSKLFSRRSNKSLTYNYIERGADVESAPLFLFYCYPNLMRMATASGDT